MGFPYEWYSHGQACETDDFSFADFVSNVLKMQIVTGTF